MHYYKKYSFPVRWIWQEIHQTLTIISYTVENILLGYWQERHKLIFMIWVEEFLQRRDNDSIACIHKYNFLAINVQNSLIFASILHYLFLFGLCAVGGWLSKLISMLIVRIQTFKLRQRLFNYWIRRYDAVLILFWFSTFQGGMESKWPNYWQENFFPIIYVKLCIEFFSRMKRNWQQIYTRSKVNMTLNDIIVNKGCFNMFDEHLFLW